MNVTLSEKEGYGCVEKSLWIVVCGMGRAECHVQKFLVTAVTDIENTRSHGWQPPDCPCRSWRSWHHPAKPTTNCATKSLCIARSERARSRQNKPDHRVGSNKRVRSIKRKIATAINSAPCTCTEHERFVSSEAKGRARASGLIT